MKLIKIFSLGLLMISCNQNSFKVIPIDSIPVTDTYHGVNIVDPYRNLENLEDSTVINWLKAQGKYAFETLEKIDGKREIINKLKHYDISTDFSYGFVRYSSNGKYFYTKKKNDEEFYKIYYRENIDSQEILVFDPISYLKKGEYSISHLKPDWKGNKLAIGFVKKGEETSEIVVLDIESKNILPGVVKNCITDFAGIHWLSDNSGFIYLYSPVNDLKNQEYWMNMKSIVYIIGSDPSELIDVFSKENNPELDLKKEDFPIVYNYDSLDGYVFAVVGGADSYYDVYYKKEKDLTLKNHNWQPLYKASNKMKQIRVDGKNNLIYLTNENAPKGRICKTSMSNPDFDNPDILVEEKKDQIITKFHNTKDGLYFTTQKNGVEERLYHLEKNGEKEVKFPTVMGEMNIQSQSKNQNFLKISAGGFLTPWTHYIYDLDTHEFSVEPIIPVTEYPDFKDLIVENLEIPSHDGVMVPISIIYHKDIKKDGENPTLFYGYGSYGSSGGASFNPSFLTWITEANGILVFPFVRGGGQKGEEWHKAGFKTTKPNTWKDMIAVTEYVIKEGYTNPNKTAIWGSSAGGILAGRAMTERPDLYKAVILTSPALNMLRSEIQPNGKNSIKEFGTVEIKEEFEALLEMDSYHHIEKGVEYPATLVTGGMKDGRVIIWDPAKFVARLQANNKVNNPILFGVKFDLGHSAMNSSVSEYYELYANTFSFALWQMGYDEYQPSF